MARNNKLQKLELTWVGKYDEQQPLEPRILIENPEYSYGEVETGVLPNGKPWKGNMLIHGDNLLALKALEQDYAGCVSVFTSTRHTIPEMPLNITTMAWSTLSGWG